MARKNAVLAGGARLSDYLSIGVIAQVFPMRAVKSALRESGRASQRRRKLPAEAMVYFVIALALFRSVSATEVMRCLLDGLRWMRPRQPLRVPSKVAISKARTRLGPEPFRALGKRIVQVLAEERTAGAWYRGRRLVAYDGTSLDVPDERRNREEFGLPGSKRGQAAFPKARVTALLEIGTRVAFAWEHGPYREAEGKQAKRLHRHLQPGMLLLADRGYLGAALWRSAARTGADLLWRARRNTVLPVRRALADGSFLSEFAGAPARVVEYTLAESDEERCRLVSTLLDPLQAPAAELAALYHERWEIETACDEIKTHLLGRSPILRAKTPDLVRQEIEGLMLAYYAVRHLLHAAAREAAEDPDRLSFVHAVRVVRRRIQNPAVSPPAASETGP